MQRSLTFSHHQIRRQFVLSAKTKPHSFRSLVKKALSLHAEIKYLKNRQGKFRFEDLFETYAPKGTEFEIVLEDESEDDRSKSEVCSQKNMSKVSGRKNPPSENQLLESKFYIDDFQLFMSEVTSKQSNGLFGIVFFNNRKKASFLGKKILRELIFEFDRIQFFYALHPIKMHTSSALLGDVLVFSLFRGKHMIFERQFPQQITAADEILNYINNLVKIGDIDFDRPPIIQKKPKNLIHVHEQRSFDHKLETSPEKLSDFGGKPNRTTQLIKTKAITPDKYDKQLKKRETFTNHKQESPIKSHVTNEISFENDLYQPEWFFEGDALNRLEKSLLSALLKANDSNLLTFLHGLNLKATNREQLNIKLLKVFLKEVIDEKLYQFTDKEKMYIEQKQENRKSFVFSSLLKLYKFGNLKQFVENLKRGLKETDIDKKTEKSQKQQKLQKRSSQQQSAVVLNIIEIPKEEMEEGIRQSQIPYSSIARSHTGNNKGGFAIKLLDCDDDKSSSFSESVSPFRENTKMRMSHIIIAQAYHNKPMDHIPSSWLKQVHFSREYSEADKAAIAALILKNDAFMIENFIPNPEQPKKMEKLPSHTVIKYLRQVESRYTKIRQRTGSDPQLALKMHKLQAYHGLVYYLYKQRVINKKQLKISFYLYTWSDLNVLAAFEVYLVDRNLDEFVDTIYSIDYNYFQNNLYEINHEEVVQFTLDTQLQLIILFLFEKNITCGQNRISLEKFIRAGDTSLLELYLNHTISPMELGNKIVEMSKDKKEVLMNLTKVEDFAEGREKEKKKDRCNFVDQVTTTRFKQFTKADLVKDCINRGQPIITQMFDKLDQTRHQPEWVEAFTDYINKIDDIHMKIVIQQIATEAGLDLQVIKEAKPDIIRGIYEAFRETKDKEDTVDSLERVARKTSRQNSPR